jgi:hypothetical protein
MTYTVSPSYFEKLPPDIASLADRYPVQLVNVADSWDKKPLPENYIPREIEVYCTEDETPRIYVFEGELIDFIPMEAERKSTSLTMIIDGQFVYIEIEGREILNRLGGVILPEIVLIPENLALNIKE